MAARLLDYFEQIKKEHGNVGRMKLAMLTQISSARAGTEADSPENIQKFEEALAQVRRDLKS